MDPLGGPSPLLSGRSRSRHWDPGGLPSRETDSMVSSLVNAGKPSAPPAPRVAAREHWLACMSELSQDAAGSRIHVEESV